jgi:hypothetical protein
MSLNALGSIRSNLISREAIRGQVCSVQGIALAQRIRSMWGGVCSLADFER